jgi:hypothetical protein
VFSAVATDEDSLQNGRFVLIWQKLGLRVGFRVGGKKTARPFNSSLLYAKTAAALKLPPRDFSGSGIFYWYWLPLFEQNSDGANAHFSQTVGKRTPH